VRHIVVIGALLALAPAARAQGLSTALVFGSTVVSDTTVDVNISGSLVVSFHGDQATGCAARGLCGYSGVVEWRPEANGATGSLEILKVRDHGRVSYAAELYVSGYPGNAAVLSSVVRRDVAGQPQGTCADASSQRGFSSFPVHGDQITVRLVGGDSSLLSTRCAGPLDTDIAPLLPAPSLSLRAALRGHRVVDLRATHSFGAGGFAGTVHSTLVLHLRDVYSNGANGPSSGGQRFRVVTESLTLVKLTGGITALVRGTANPDVCLLLDSCGLQGTFAIQPQPRSGTGELVVYGPARRPYRDFLAALGLNRHGRAGGLFVYGTVDLTAGGVGTADFMQSGECRDSAPLGAGYVAFQPGAKLVTASYSPTGSLRVRCPGPELGQQVGYLADGTIPLRALAARVFSFSLTPEPTFSDDGYAGRQTGTLSITLRRGRVKQRLFTQQNFFQGALPARARSLP
jgi:hypothetical protein